MSWIARVILGGVAGFHAGISTGYDTWRGVFRNIIVGFLGALAGSWMLGSLGAAETPAFRFMAALVAVASAAIMLFLFNLVCSRIRA